MKRRLCEIGKMIADALGNREITFKENDRPYIALGNAKYPVMNFSIDSWGDMVMLTLDDNGEPFDYNFYLDFNSDEDEEFADNPEDYEDALYKMYVPCLLDKVCKYLKK